MESTMSKIIIYYCGISFLIIAVNPGTVVGISRCEDGSFSCKNSKGTHSDCVDLALVCDEVCNCANCEDEKECHYDEPDIAPTTGRPPKPNCPYDFWCSNNICTDTEYVCDGEDDCGDNSDERSCISCGSGTFSCGGYTNPGPYCIDPVLVCDKVCDCNNCEDENRCYYDRYKSNCNSSFWCSNNHCVGSIFVCDMWNNCGDHSDERACSRCSPGEFSCNDGNCISPNFVCDTLCDCANCNDESGCYTPPQEDDDSDEFNVFYAIVIPAIIGVCLVVVSTAALKCLWRKKDASRDERNHTLRYMITEQELEEQYQAEMDLPPEYEVVNDGPAHSVSPSLYSDDSSDGLPTYNDVNVPMGGNQLDGEVNASMVTEEEVEPPPPSYDTVADNLSTNIASSESSSIDGDSVRFGGSSSYSELNAQMEDQSQGEVNLSMVTEEGDEPPPPSYDAIDDNLDTDITSTESSSIDGDSVRFRRSTSENELNLPSGGNQLDGGLNASMVTEEETEPPPPSYDTVADNLSTNIASTESSSTDGDSVRFGRSTSENELNLPTGGNN